MTKLFKCQKCEQLLDHLTGQIVTKINNTIHLDEQGTPHTTQASAYTPKEPMEYTRTECNHSSEDINDFIQEVNCDCEHDETYGEDHDDFEFDICCACGLIAYITCADGSEFDG